MGSKRRQAARRTSRLPPDGVRAHEHARPPLVLVVDDNEDNRDVFADYLIHAGLRVERAVDGEHALLKILTIMPDVVVMDLAMPIVDGWEATRRIKSHPRTSGIPVIAITGHATPDNLSRARDMGATKVLTKPCSPAALLAVIQDALGGK